MDKSDDQSVKEKTNAASPTIDDYSLPPYNPHNPVGKMSFIYMFWPVVGTVSQVWTLWSWRFFSLSTGMEFLAPKTGFFCKACNRFFSGAKEAEMAHCKTQKHYDNVKVSTY